MPTPAEMVTEAAQLARTGEKDRARALLLAAVAEDETLEHGWLWLGLLLDDPADRITALENALTLNPDNARARALLDKLQDSLAAPITIPDPLAALRAEAEQMDRDRPPHWDIANHPGHRQPDLLGDPMQCIYCGTKIQDEQTMRCPHCRRSLATRKRMTRPEFTTWLIAILSGVAVLLGVFITGLAVAQAYQDAVLRELQGYIALASPQVAATLDPSEFTDLRLWFHSIRAGLLLLQLVVYTQTKDLGFNTGLVVYVLDLLVLFGFALAQVLGGPLFWVALLLSGVLAFLLAQSNMIRAGYPVQIRLVTDTKVKDANTFARYASEAEAEGKVALAGAYWLRAAGAAPSTPTYYLRAAACYAALDRPARAALLLRDGLNMMGSHPGLEKALATYEGLLKRKG